MRAGDLSSRGPQIDNENGLGATPNNANIDYAGLKVKMRPGIFLDLAAPLNQPPSEFMMTQLRAGEPIASPTVYLDFADGWSLGSEEDKPDLTQPMTVNGHEGRNRMLAILELYGDIDVETHIFIRGLRNRHMNNDIIAHMRRKLKNETGTRTIYGPLFRL